MSKIIATGQISILDFNDAPSLTAFISANVAKTQVYNPDNGSYTPNWSSVKPTLTPSLFVSSEGSSDQISKSTVTWYDAAAPSTKIVTGGAFTVTGNELTINQNLLTGSVYSKTFIAEITWIDPATNAPLVIKTDFTFNRSNHGAKGVKGDDAIVAVLSNDSHTIPTDSAGNNGVYGGAETTIVIYEGGKDVSSSWSVSVAASSGVTGSLTTRTYKVTGMSSDEGYVDITATRSGYSTIVKRFNLSKNKQGESATSYWLVASAAAIQKDVNANGAYTPSTITVTGKRQIGESSPANYATRFIIAESTDGTNFTTKYTSSANETSKTHTPSANIQSVRIRMYAAGGTSNLLDEQIIPVVSTGQDAVFVTTWAPSGNIFKNDLVDSLTAEADVYNGGVILASGVTYQWFVQKSGATDQGAGAGWEKLTTTNAATYGVTGSVTSKTIAVTAAGVVNIAAFKVKATYKSKSYVDTIIFYDQTDPIMVVVDSSNGVIFKNGSVSSQLLCRLYQNGVEIDQKLASPTTGYKYKYTWTKLNADGNQDMSFGSSGTKTGKWIDITDQDIYQRAVFKVEIS